MKSRSYKITKYKKKRLNKAVNGENKAYGKPTSKMKNYTI